MADFRTLFREILALADGLRPGYMESLGSGISAEQVTNLLLPFVKSKDDIPSMIYEIYTQITGTIRSIEDQKFMDFIPGYRLISIHELPSVIQAVGEMFNSTVSENGGYLFPVFANYSSDFVCVLLNRNTGNEEIYDAIHDDTTKLMHINSEVFLCHLKKCYTEKVYFTDEDGYLDYDMDAEWEIGKRLNPGVEYWEEP